LTFFDFYSIINVKEEFWYLFRINMTIGCRQFAFAASLLKTRVESFLMSNLFCAGDFDFITL